ncbi:lipid II flippase MurJ [Humidesulfovibrio idahonensis]
MSRGFVRTLRAEFASRLARDTLTVFLFSGAGRAVALGKEMLVAALFGVGGLLDAYVLAFLLPSLLVNMFGASFASALIPALGKSSARESVAGSQPQGLDSDAAKQNVKQHDAQTRRVDHGPARRLLGRALLAQALLVLATALVLALLPVQALRVLAPSLEPERLALVKAMQTALLPVFVLGSLSQTLAASVNYRGGFKGPALAATLSLLTTVLVIALAHGALGVNALVAGVDAGAALEFCMLLALLRRAWFGGSCGVPGNATASAEQRPERPGAAGCCDENSLDHSIDHSDSHSDGHGLGHRVDHGLGHCAAAKDGGAPGLLHASEAADFSGGADALPDSPPCAVAGRRVTPAAISLLPSSQPPPAPLRPLLRDWSLLALGASTLALSSFIDNAIASTLGEGAVSTLSYAWKLPSGFVTLLGLTLSTVLLPYFTSLAHRAPAGELARASRGVVKRLLLVCAPLAVAGALASPLLVALLFQRGRFDAQAAGLVSVVQACYFAQLPFYLLCIVTQRMLQALARFRFLLLLQAGLVAVNACTSYGLSRVMGVAGIAVSSTLMFALCAGISLLALRRQFRARQGGGAA